MSGQAVKSALPTKNLKQSLLRYQLHSRAGTVDQTELILPGRCNLSARWQGLVISFSSQPPISRVLWEALEGPGDTLMTQPSLPALYRHQSSFLSQVRAFCFIFILFAPLLFVNFLQFLAFPLRWLAPLQNRRWNTLMARIYWGFIAWMIQHVNNIDLQIRGDRLEPTENSILICNHQSAFDTLLILVWAEEAKRVGTLRFFAKDILKIIPGPGWGMYFLDCLFLKRSWEEDEQNIRATLDRYKQSPIPYCWVIFPEGTRSTPDKVLASQQKALSRDRPVLDRVLSPRPRGFVATVHGLGDNLSSVMDMTIHYPDGTPSVWQLMQGASPRVIIDVKRYRRETLPTLQMENWLEDRFVEKNQALQSDKA